MPLCISVFSRKWECYLSRCWTGDAILIRLPYDQEIYLIDTGGTILPNKEEWQRKKHEFSVGNDILIPYLQKEGIKRSIN